MRKYFKLLGFMCLVFVMVLTGCSSNTGNVANSGNAAQSDPVKSEASDKPQKLTVWTLQQADANIEQAQQEAVKAFEEEFNTTVEVTAFPYQELQDKLLISVIGGEGPDVLLLDQIWVAQYAASNYIEPLDERLANSDIQADNYFPGAWGAGTYNDKVYAIPFDVGVWSVLYYNKDMFAEAGLDPEQPPVTWDEFMEYGRILTKDGKYGTANWGSGGDAGNMIVDGFTVSAGGQLLNEAGDKTLINEEAGVKALEFWAGLNEISPPGSVGRGEEDAFNLFAGGQVAMGLYGEWGQDTINTRAPDMNYGVANLPKYPGGESVGTFGGFNLGINAKSQNKDLAWEFIKYSTNAENQKFITMLTPAHKQAADEYLKEKRKYPEVIFSQLSNAIFRPTVANYNEIAKIQKDAMQKVMTGTTEAKAALDEAADKINALLSK